MRYGTVTGGRVLCLVLFVEVALVGFVQLHPRVGDKLLHIRDSLAVYKAVPVYTHVRT